MRVSNGIYKFLIYIIITVFILLDIFIYSILGSNMDDTIIFLQLRLFTYLANSSLGECQTVWKEISFLFLFQLTCEL